MATTNVQQWNPTAANQETDGEYTADSQRAGGATSPSEFDSRLANKLFYQCTTYLDGLFSAFAAKGFATSDSNLSTLTAQCANFLTTADVLPNVTNVAYASSVALNAAASNGFYLLALTGNLTIAAIDGLLPGQPIALYYQQDATGGRTITFPSIMVGAAQPDPSPNAVSLQLFGYDAVTGYLRAAGPLVSDNGAFFSSPVAAPAGLTAPTVASSDNSANVVTTAWAKYGLTFVAGSTGYIRLPAWMGGFMMQWGSLAEDNFGHGTTLNFPTPFANAAFVIVANDNGTSSNPATPLTVGSGIISKTQYLISSSGTASVGWIAMGY